MTSWKQFPLIRLFPFLLLGILSAKWVVIPFLWFYTLLGFLLLNLLVVQFYSAVLTYRYRWLFGVLTGILILCIGNSVAHLNDDRQNLNHISHHTLEQKTYYLGKVIANPVKKQKSWKVVVAVKAGRAQGGWISQSGKILLYISTLDTLPIHYGDEILFYTRLFKPNGARNPGGFDQESYLSQQQIYYLGYVKKDQWQKTSDASDFSINRIAHKLHQRAISYLHQMRLEPHALGVASALLVGDRNYLDPNIKQAFSSAGTMHVLAVSGLHVGIVYLLFSQLFQFIRGRWGGYAKAVLVLGILWSYAMITGLSPSVVRAATMFSFFVIGKAIHRQANVLNIVFASLTILIIMDPELIYSVGLQLSYAAVIAIVVIYPWMYKRFKFKTWILDKSWSIICISVCAQLGTFPLAIFYFHQFPNYFLFSNLLVVPLVPTVIGSGLLAMLVIAVPYLNNWTEYVFQFLVGVLIKIVQFFDQLPFNVSSGLFPSLGDVFILYGITILVIYWLLMKNKWAFLFGLGLSCFLIGKSVFSWYVKSNQKILVVYDARVEPVYDIVTGRKCFVSGSIAKLEPYTKNEIQISRDIMGIRDAQPLSEYTNSISNGLPAQGFIQLNGQRIILVNNEYRKIPEGTIHADWLIVSNSYNGSIRDLEILFVSKAIVFDSTVRGRKLSAWLKYCLENGINTYSVHNSGAFVAHL